jgi:hypothetical protein
MSQIFKKINTAAFKAGINPRTPESREWFRKQAQKLTRVNPAALMKEDNIQTKGRSYVGHMYMFFYDPKHKEKLPYYDAFPLIFMVEKAKGGFYGLNLHYLPPILRAQFLNQLLEIKSNDKYNDTTRLKLSYDLIKSSSKFRLFAPCFKHYLTPHVKSRFAKVPANDWEIATFLPTAQWKKQKAGYVYKQSRGMI